MSDDTSVFDTSFVRSVTPRDLRACAAMKPEKTELDTALKAAGMSQAELARRIGTSRQNVARWASGAVRMQPEQAAKIGPILDVSPAKLLLGDLAQTLGDMTQTTGYRVEPNVIMEGPAWLPPMGGPRDIQELGITVGGFGADDSAFEMNGQVIDMVIRPPGIANRKGVFALRVGNTSMVPKFEDGERVYVEPRKAAVGEYVVVELHPREEGAPGKSFIKRLVNANSELVTVEQFNPAGRLEFERPHIKQLLRVIPWPELLGVG